MTPTTQFIRVLGGFEDWQTREELDCQVISSNEPITCFSLTTKNLCGRKKVFYQELKERLLKKHGKQDGVNYEETDEEIEDYLNEHH